MSEAKSGISCPHGEVSAQPRSGRNLFLHCDARRTQVNRAPQRPVSCRYINAVSDGFGGVPRDIASLIRARLLQKPS
jgi:hypothetical protein